MLSCDPGYARSGKMLVSNINILTSNIVYIFTDSVKASGNPEMTISNLVAYVIVAGNPKMTIPDFVVYVIVAGNPNF